MAVPPQSTTPSVFVPALATKLRTDLSLSTQQVKIVDWETIRGAYTMTALEKNIGICLGNLRPTSELQGAGRYSYKVVRTLYIRLITISHNDPAGRNEVGLAAHWAFEDQVMNSLVLAIAPPLALPLVPVSLTGAEWQITFDKGRYSSVLAFDVTYPLALDNTCG